jgi:hypothetical protein
MLYRIHLDTGGFRIRNFTITTTAAHFGCEIKMYLSNIRNFYVILHTICCHVHELFILLSLYYYMFLVYIITIPSFLFSRLIAE